MDTQTDASNNYTWGPKLSSNKNCRKYFNIRTTFHQYENPHDCISFIMIIHLPRRCCLYWNRPMVLMCNLYTVQCHYNAFKFLTNIHKRHPVWARYGVSSVGAALIDILPQFLQWCVQYLVILDHVIMALNCIDPQFYNKSIQGGGCARP